MTIQIFSLEGLTVWLRTQPPEAEYNYSNNTDCLYHHYFRAYGVPVCNIGDVYWYDIEGKEHRLPPEFNDVAIKTPHTYGAALARAMKML